MIGAVLLLLLGLGLVLAEVLFPSFGVLSVLATAALVGSVALAFGESTTLGIRFLVALALLVPVVILAGFKLFPRTPFGRRMTVAGLSFGSSPTLDARDLGLAGKTGVVEAPCRPAGMARIEGRRVDVVARGEFLDVGARVRVAEVQGNRVVVTREEDGAG